MTEADTTSDAELTPQETLYDTAVLSPGGQTCLYPAVENYVDLISKLRADGYWACMDLFAVDYLTYEAERALPSGLTAERFEVVVNLVDPTAKRRIRVKLQVSEAEPSIPTITHLHPGMINPEREAFDMFGITFDGHPDPSRILMPEDWEGHPLRKDYSMGRIPVQFKAATSAR